MEYGVIGIVGVHIFGGTALEGPKWECPLNYFSKFLIEYFQTDGDDLKTRMTSNMKMTSGINMT